jgi:hypothetical protein
MAASGNSIGGSTTVPERPRKSLEWIPVGSHPDKVIAKPTLDALRTILTRPPQSGVVARVHRGEVALQRTDHPALHRVPGLDRVDVEGVGPVGLVSIAHDCFVAYRLVGEALQELMVEVDEAGDQLCIVLEPPVWPAA